MNYNRIQIVIGAVCVYLAGYFVGSYKSGNKSGK